MNIYKLKHFAVVFVTSVTNLVYNKRYPVLFTFLVAVVYSVSLSYSYCCDQVVVNYHLLIKPCIVFSHKTTHLFISYSKQSSLKYYSCIWVIL